MKRSKFTESQILFALKQNETAVKTEDVCRKISRPGRPTDNPFIESFNGSFRDECLNTNWILSLQDARAKIELWRRDYNSYRPHSSLQDRTPEQVEFEVLNYRVNSNLAVSK